MLHSAHNETSFVLFNLGDARNALQDALRSADAILAQVCQATGVAYATRADLQRLVDDLHSAARWCALAHADAADAGLRRALMSADASAMVLAQQVALVSETHPDDDAIEVGSLLASLWVTMVGELLLGL